MPRCVDCGKGLALINKSGRCRKCLNIYNHKLAITRQTRCIDCGSSFASGRNRHYERKRCQRCANILKIRSQRTKYTKIEMRMYKLLDERGYKHIDQYHIPGVTLADSFLPQFNTVLFTDGAYWHNELPGQKERDERINKKLTAIGYNVIRFLYGDRNKFVSSQYYPTK